MRKTGPIKIAYIFSTLENCGPNNVTLNLIKHLDRRFEVHVVTLSPDPANSRRRDFEALGVRLHSLHLPRWAGMFLAASRLKALLNQLAPDVVHHYGLRADLLAALVCRGRRTLSTLHCNPYRDYAMNAYGPFSFLWASLQMMALSRADKTVAVSDYVATSLSQWKKVIFSAVPNGVATEELTPVDEAQRQILRSRLGLPAKDQIYVSTGPLISRKNPLLLIKAFKRSAGSGRRLLFLGDGPMRKACQRAMGHSNNIELRGRVENVRDYLQASNFCLSASQAEGLPLGVLEAMSCGLPAVLSDIPSHGELSNNAAGAVQLFPCDSVEALEAAINGMGEGRWKEKSNQTRRLIETYFSADTMAAAYEKHYLALLNLAPQSLEKHRLRMSSADSATSPSEVMVTGSRR